MLYAYADQTPVDRGDATGLKCRADLLWGHNSPVLRRKLGTYKEDLDFVWGLGCHLDNARHIPAGHAVGGPDPSRGALGISARAARREGNAGFNDPPPPGKETVAARTKRAAKGFSAMIAEAWAGVYEKALWIAADCKCICVDVHFSLLCPSGEVRDSSHLAARYRIADVDTAQTIGKIKDMSVPKYPNYCGIGYVIECEKNQLESEECKEEQSCFPSIDSGLDGGGPMVA